MYVKIFIALCCVTGTTRFESLRNDAWGRGASSMPKPATVSSPSVANWPVQCAWTKDQEAQSSLLPVLSQQDSPRVFLPSYVVMIVLKKSCLAAAEPINHGPIADGLRG